MTNKRDRTAEFFSTANSIQQEPSSSSRGPKNGFHSKTSLVARHRKSEQKKTLDSAGSARFVRVAARISQGIQGTTAKLERLGQLASRKSLFDNGDDEIQQLTHVIKQDLKTLNSEIDHLQIYMQNHRKQFVSGQSNKQGENIISTLKVDLASTTRSFAAVLQTRTQNLKIQNRHKQQFSSSNTTIAKRRRERQKQYSQQVLLEEELSDSTPLNPQADMSSMQMVQRDDAYRQSRVAAVETIEQTIAELAQMYQRLASIVAMQNDLCIRIDEDVEKTVVNTSEGYSQLLKYFDGLSNNRWLILKVFFVLIIFAVFFIVFVA